MKTALSDETRGVNINGIHANNLSNADDTVLIASTLQDIQILVKKVNVESEEYALTMRVEKTKLMLISKRTMSDKSKYTINQYNK